MKSRNTRSQTVIRPARAGLLLGGQFGDAPQPVVLKENVHAVSAKGLFVLSNDAAFGGFEYVKQIINAQSLANNAHGQTPYEFRFKTEVDKIA